MIKRVLSKTTLGVNNEKNQKDLMAVVKKKILEEVCELANKLG